jgi:restriction system protein
MVKPSSKGVDGEIRVALDIATLNRAEYHAVHNVTVMVDDGTTQIDHVVISKYGIFVVETKNYTGWIFGRERESKWTRSANGQSNSFQNPIRQNVRHIKSLSELLGVEEYLFHSVIAFCGDSEFKTSMPANVLTTGYADYIRSKRIALFSEAEASTLADKLKSSMLDRGEETDRKHLESLRQRHANKEAFNATTSDMGLQGTKGKRARTFRSRLPAAVSVRTAERIGLGVPSKKQQRPSDRLNKSLAAATVLVVVLIFATNNFISGMGNLVSNMSTHHQATASMVMPERGMDSTTSERQPPRSNASLTPVLANVPAVPHNSDTAMEDAWGRWHTLPPGCENLTDRNMVECGNKHIRARQEFERLYARGKVR